MVRFCPTWALRNTDLLVTATKPPALAVLPRTGALGGAPGGTAHPCLSPGLGMLQKTHPGTRSGMPWGWAQPGMAQPCSFSPLTLSQGFSQPGQVSHSLQDGFSCRNAAFLHKAPLSPWRTEQAWASSSPFRGDSGWAVNTNCTPLALSPAPTKPPCAPQLPHDGPSSGDAPRVQSNPKPRG